MSAEDETFDIDLYGEEQEGEETQQYNVPAEPGSAVEGATHNSHDGAQDENVKDAKSSDASNKLNNIEAPVSTQSLKRKASNEENDNSQQHDERPLDQGAQVSLKLTDLQWWTTEEDLRHFCAQSHTEAELVEVAFGEHKQNGKSKGEAYLEFKTPQAAGLAKRAIEKANAELEAEGKTSVVGKAKISVWYTAPGNPFKAREGQGKKEAGGTKHGQGAYNNYNNPRGGFTAGRGRGGYNARGGGYGSNQNANASNNTYNNGMMGGYGNMGFGGFPTMAMNPNAMMNSMMAGGGFNMMGMPGMMAARGGANMMNRGGWNGAMGQGSYQQGGYGAGWDNSKKQRRE